MKFYIGNANDDCFFYRCNYCMASFLIEDEKKIHQTRCELMQSELLRQATMAEKIISRLPNIEEQC